MRVTRYTDYSLRVLIYLGLKRDGLATIQDIADCYNISKNHLTKVVHDLNRRGYVTTVRGKGGGLRLQADPSQVRLGDFVRESEDLTLMECFGSENQCRLAPACSLKNMLAEALKAFLDSLNHYTLADVMGPHEHLAELLDTVTIIDPQDLTPTESHA